MLTITGFVASEFGSEQIGGMWHCYGEIAVLGEGRTSKPAFRQFFEHGFRHEIDVPAVRLLKLTAYDGIVAEPGEFIRISHRIGIHAIFRQTGGDAFLRRMPEQSCGANQSH